MSDVQDFGPVFDIPEGEGNVEQIETPQEAREPQEQQGQPPAEPEPQAEPQPEEPKEEARHVPLVALLDEREKRQATQREKEALEQRLRDLEAKQAPQPTRQVPDPYEDPQGYNEFVQGEIEQRAFAMKLEMSGRFAEQVHGKETVDQAIAWGNEQARLDPTLSQRFRMQPDPVGFVVEQFKREQFFKQYGSDPSALQQLQTTPQTAAPQQQGVPPLSAPQAPPRSLANAPGAGGHQSVPDGSVLQSIKFALD